MDTLLKSIYYEFNKLFGIPSQLIDLIKHKQIVSNRIVHHNGIMNSVIRWDEWIKLKHDRNDHIFSELTNLIIIEISKQEVELQEINSFTSSKSSFDTYTNFDDAAKECTPKYIENITLSNLNLHLEHLNKYAWANEYLSLYYYSWYNKNYLWNNSDGSHHFVAAKYIANRINQKIYKKANITIYKINQNILNSFLGRYSMFLINNSVYKLNNALRNFGCEYYLADLPYPLNSNNPNTKILILPKNNKQSMSVSKTLHAENFISWNNFIIENLL